MSYETLKKALIPDSEDESDGATTEVVVRDYQKTYSELFGLMNDAKVEAKEKVDVRGAGEG